MSDLYRRVLLWHKLVAQTTGGLALCSAKRALPRDEAMRWAEALRNVADEIGEVLAGRPFILDERGQRVVVSDSGPAPAPRFFDSKGERHVEPSKPVSGVNPQNKAVSPPTPRAGGLRIAKRKTQ